MSSISHHLPGSFFSQVPNRAEQGNFRSTQFEKTSFKENKSTDITLVTAEGDRVTFSSFSSLDAGHSIHTSRGLVDGVESRTEISSSYLSEASGFEMMVQGDLNEQELKDIRKAFKTIEKMADNFFAGKTDHALEKAEKIASLGSISRFEAVIQYERSASIQQGTSAHSSRSLPESAGESAQPPMPLETLQAVKPPTTPEIKSPAAKPDEPESLQESMVDKMTEAILKTNVALEKAAKQSHKFLNHLFDKFSNKRGVKPSDLKLFREIQADLLKNMLEEITSDKMAQQAIDT